ncbi:NUDIX domain-containing protein [Nocardia cyriacigeorgica]|uniref:NTP pyrophosphohydrolases containing a Zn-finger, probably nucleic-acid-binding n=1 Tax=Nocardia cyriacigeorgica TaxID=135487 RepID=A0A4U8W474_9NOCA|nr:NUDIX domain-containing protein [Nocardia cyriacigeorgica]MBF6097283.1 NUDIX domain-containing protein [Nocardia cyriacigeorgica]MBF6160861.1 NUDIX domain-containing protein [Nocardia cyriacigeorgica]MBF6201555.1 NUDIX domain-containing protein [Nocardia cyriacigeorgica]MBF6344123.1 NUDIX domain-containing protein [Nocardia cyriacigeorgica]MBF6395399.1 NUDIX domain-containing protein [Nocardia cyriacigeorgica]
MSAETLHASATELLEAWSPAAGPDASLREAMLAFLGSAPRGCLREHAAGHITASAVVFSAGGDEVLLTLHPRVGRWIQLGGHCEEGDLTVADAALREATEESGIAGLRLEPGLYGAQAHPITCSLGVPTRHLDLLFRITAPAGAVPVRSAESTDLRWWPIDALPDNADVLIR